MTSKAEYLKRYLSKTETKNENKKKKNKKKNEKNVKCLTNIRIIDNDIPFPKENHDSEDDECLIENIEELDEDLPSVVRVIDDRPMDMIIQEKLKTGEWKPLEGWNRENAPVGTLCEIKKETDSIDDIKKPERTYKKKLSKKKTKDIKCEIPSIKIEPEDIKTEPPDSDVSPPRKTTQGDDESDVSPPRKNRQYDDEPDVSPPRRRTADGKKSGLQDAKSCKAELESLRQREKRAFEALDPTISGKGAETKVRGRLKEDEERKRVKREKGKISEEVKAQYVSWSKGLKQLERTKERIEEDLREMNKPLARFKDDVDLDEHLKGVEREEDPMIDYIRQKKVKKAIKEGVSMYPTYSGPQPELNRYKIQPGYRWDGVDRSNGFEKRYFENINKRTAVVGEAYSWSTEDM